MSKRSWICQCGSYFRKDELCDGCGYCPKCCKCPETILEDSEVDWSTDPLGTQDLGLESK